MRDWTEMLENWSVQGPLLTFGDCNHHIVDPLTLEPPSAGGGGLTFKQSTPSIFWPCHLFEQHFFHELTIWPGAQSGHPTHFVIDSKHFFWCLDPLLSVNSYMLWGVVCQLCDWLGQNTKLRMRRRCGMEKEHTSHLIWNAIALKMRKLIKVASVPG